MYTHISPHIPQISYFVRSIFHTDVEQIVISPFGRQHISLHLPRLTPTSLDFRRTLGPTPWTELASPCVIPGRSPDTSGTISQYLSSATAVTAVATAAKSHDVSEGHSARHPGQCACPELGRSPDILVSYPSISAVPQESQQCRRSPDPYEE